MQYHLEKSLQRDMDRIRNKVIEMSEFAEKALNMSLQALTERNRQLAYLVILRDRYIDEMEKELDRLCLEFIVKQQPAAGNLRFVYAAIKINNELERVGDYAESIARHFLTVNTTDPKFSYSKVFEIAKLSIPMLHNAIQSFIDKDPKLAKATMKMEDKVDNIRNTINQDLLKLRSKNKLPKDSLPSLMIIASRFERVADQSCNICEEVLYMCTGENIKHRGVEVFRILFVDDHNSCLSQMAESIGGTLEEDMFIFSSAGITPQLRDPKTVSFLAEKGIDISKQTSKYLNQILNLEHYEVIVSLCPKADVAFLPPPTKTVGIQWHLEDPSKLKGSEEEIEAAYEKAYQYLDTHIKELVEAIIGDINKKEEVH